MSRTNDLWLDRYHKIPDLHGSTPIHNDQWVSDELKSLGFNSEDVSDHIWILKEMEDAS